MSNQTIIPVFLDWTGTINEILFTEKEIGAVKLKRFFDSIKNLENKTNSKAIITVVSGSSLSSSKSRLNIINQLAINYGMSDLFQFMVAEYSGYLIESNGTVTKLDSISSELLYKQDEIKKFLENIQDIKINTDVTTYINIIFSNQVPEEVYNEYTEKIREQCGNTFDFLASFDEYGKEFDIKSKSLTKKNAVSHMIPIILNKYKGYNIPFILAGGDTEKEDFQMSLADTGGIKIIPISPSNNDISKDIIDRFNVIVGKGDNIDGISDSIDRVSEFGGHRYIWKN